MKRRRLFAGGFFFILSSCVQKIKGGAVRKNAKVQGADEKSCKENEKNCEPGDVNKAKPNGDKAEGSEEDGIGEMPSETTVKPQDGVEQDLAGLVVTLDVGHSPKPDPGTPLPWDLGAAGHGVDEHEENHFVAKRTSELLKARGAKVYVLFYPRIVTLTSRGQGAREACLFPFITTQRRILKLRVQKYSTIPSEPLKKIGGLHALFKKKL
jgi:N-acetylmuramoyl-L-alanine amidase